MKVCFVGFENLPVLAREFDHHGIGGEQVQHTLLAKALAARGYQVSMVVGDYGQPDAAAWGGVVTYKAFRPDSGVPVLRFVHPRWTGTWSALMRADADVYYTSCAGMLVGLVAMFSHWQDRGFIHRLAIDTDADPEKLLIRYTRDKKLYEYGLRRADCVLCQHPGQQRALMQNYNVASIVADMMVDPPGRELDFTERDIEILWVANLRDFKRPDLAIELARRMPSRHIHLIGGPQSGFSDLYERVGSAAQTLPNLTFHGPVPYHSVCNFYDRTRVFINTSDVEGFPNSFLQSWIRGVPVVAFFDPDGLIKREGLGLSPSSIDAMAIAIERLLTDEGEWRNVSARCKTYMRLKHGDDVVLKPYIAAIGQAARTKRYAVQ